MRINEPEPVFRNPLSAEAQSKLRVVEEILGLTGWSADERRKLMTKPFGELVKFRDMVFADRFPALPDIKPITTKLAEV